MSVDVSGIDIERQPPEAPFVDIMGGAARWEVPVHEHGFIALVDVMPRLVPEGDTADSAIVQAARVSYGRGTKQVSQDRGLIRYLARHRHTTPFEMVEFKFHCAMPVFVARQWIRHRTANVNEYSARYSIMPDRFYRPSVDEVRRQSQSNRQGGEQPTDELTAAEFLEFLDEMHGQYERYESLLDKGVTREQARIALPISVYTEWYWKNDLHNTLHFLSLRMDEHAQKEIRDYAYAMYALIQPLVPIACEAFVDYQFEAVKLSRLEIKALRDGRPLDTTNKRELAEWEAKRGRLGL
ncbi:MAG: FAD-dependent thymidylate synthase [Anaerolineae bacterium]